MHAEPRLILLEFNELTPALLHRFMDQGALPNFARFHRESVAYTTDAEEQGETLNPWVQWVTVHSGLPYAEHGVLNLNEGRKLAAPRIWDVASAHGRRVWVCGSMNVHYTTPLNGYVLPDPWSVDVPPYPDDAGLDAYYRFVQTQVQEHTNDRVPLDARAYARFLAFMTVHGLSPRTAGAIVRQLARERIGDTKWKRTVLLDKLQFDLFRSVYRTRSPHLSTFFLNSTAHLQHAYWRCMDPEPFSIKPSDGDRAAHGEAVLFGYREMDALLGRFMALAGSDVTLVFATALSQQPCLVYEEGGGRRFFRPRNFDAFLAFAGVPAPYKCTPVMSEQFHVYLESADAAADAERRLAALQVGGRPLMRVTRDGEHSVFAGATLYEALPADVRLVTADGGEAPFFELFYQSDTIKSGMHHPDGALWIRGPQREHRVVDERVSLTRVAPTLLRAIGIAPPAHMRAEALPWRGASRVRSPAPARQAARPAAPTASASL